MSGECTRCADPGACCRFMVFELKERLTDDQARWAELHPGVHIAQTGTGSFLRLDVACSALEEPAGRCGIHDSPTQPDLCKNWPTDPIRMLGTPYAGRLDVCVYAIEALSEAMR